MTRKFVILGILSIAIASVDASATETATSGAMKTFDCKGIYEIQQLRLNATSAEIAVGLYQIAAVLPSKQAGMTFSGASYDLTDVSVTCTEAKR